MKHQGTESLRGTVLLSASWRLIISSSAKFFLFKAKKYIKSKTLKRILSLHFCLESNWILAPSLLPFPFPLSSSPSLSLLPPFSHSSSSHSFPSALLSPSATLTQFSHEHHIHFHLLYSSLTPHLDNGVGRDSVERTRICFHVSQVHSWFTF